MNILFGKRRNNNSLGTKADFKLTHGTVMFLHDFKKYYF